MNIKVDRAALRLGVHEIVSVFDSAGARLQCLRGALWVTQHLDPKDHFLEAGDELALDRPDLTLIQALVPAELVLHEPSHRPSLLRRTAVSLGAALRVAGKRIAQSFGPEAISVRRLHGRCGAL